MSDLKQQLDDLRDHVERWTLNEDGQYHAMPGPFRLKVVKGFNYAYVFTVDHEQAGKLYTGAGINAADARRRAATYAQLWWMNQQDA